MFFFFFFFCKDVIHFHVHEHLPHLSNHAKLPLKLSVSVANFSFSAEKDITYDMPSSYRWFKDSSFIFQKAFDMPDCYEMD